MFARELLNIFAHCSDEYGRGDSFEDAMSLVCTYSSYTLFAALVAAALTCAPARAEPLFGFFRPTAADPDRATVPGRTTFQAEPHFARAAAGPTDENAQLAPRLHRQIVDYPSREAPGTIVVDTPHTSSITCSAAARRSATASASAARASPGRASSRSCARPNGRTGIRRRRCRAPALPAAHGAGGPGNPLGARALYIGGTEYRIHGTNEPDTDRQAHVVGLHPAHQRQHRRPLQSRADRRQGDRAAADGDAHARSENAEAKPAGAELAGPKRKPPSSGRVSRHRSRCPMRSERASRASVTWNVIRRDGLY